MSDGHLRSRGSRMAVAVGLLSIAVSFDAALHRPTAAAEPTPGRTNVILVLADDLGYGDVGCYGNADIDTPTLDMLARQGVRLTACYAPSSLCSASRAGITSGRGGASSRSSERTRAMSSSR